MILILVSSHHKEAATLERHLQRDVASIFTCADLAEQSTNLFYPGFEHSAITIAGVTVPISEITGVINLLPVILPEELYFLPEEERHYQAAEFHALLTFFLNALNCPVINRPSGAGLAGTFNHSLYWISMARKLQIPTIDLVIDSHLSAYPSPDDKSSPYLETSCLNQLVSTVSNHAPTDFPDPCNAHQYTLQLARHSNSVYLKAAFQMVGTTIALASASLFPDIRNVDLMLCIIQYLKNATLV